MTDIKKKIKEIMKDVAEEPDDINELDVLTTHRAMLLLNQLVDLFNSEMEKQKEDLIEDIQGKVKNLREGEVGLCPECNPDGKHYYPCWHQELRREALNQVLDSLKEKEGEK